jgi:hypothetical protein
MAGSRQKPLENQDHDKSEDADGDRGGHRLAVGDAVHECPCLCAQAVCIDGEPEELRQLTDTIVTARPFM